MKKLRVLLVSLALFLVLLPLVSKITFFQNDDWVYYETVSRFMRGDLTLHPYISPTFYVQGVIAVLFAKIFSINRLPVLTLLFSVANFYLVVTFLCLRLKKPLKLSLLLGFLYFFNPINIYLTLGFMTEVYFMFFFLFSLWLISLFEETKNKRYLYYFFLIVFIGLLLRQVSLFLPLGVGIYYAFKKEFKLSAINFAVFGLYYYYYQNIFQMTQRMLDIPLQFHHLADFDYIFALLVGVLIVCTAFLLPVIFFSIDFKALGQKRIRGVVFVLLVASLYLLINKYFNPHEVSWGEFPYFENTFERTGFYPRGIIGTKYYFRWNYDLFYYWDIFSKILLVFMLSYIFLYKKRLINLFSVLIVTYLGMLVVTETFYDRYTIVLIPLIIMFLAQNYLKDGKLLRFSLLSFFLFFSFFSYQLANDFVYANKYVWERSKELVRSESIDEKYIQGTNAWKLSFKNHKRDYIYVFSYDSPKVNEGFSCCFDLVEEKEIAFPGSIFVNPRIYLYQVK